MQRMVFGSLYELRVRLSHNQSIFLVFESVLPALQTRENLPVALRATYPENRVALNKF